MVTVQSSELPWHPRITPYRLTVLATTISLGTVKAVSTQTGSVFIPTTFEWISGTVVFLMLFIISPYDSGEDPPRYLSWLFEPDCMDLIWHLRTITFSIPRPKYLSEERTQAIPFKASHPPITSYRILVSSSVLAFGISKAVFGYLGDSTAATWTDWLLGVVATSIFYFLGFYEKSSSNLWPAFFSDDQCQHLYSAGTATSYGIGIAALSAWIILWKDILRRTWLDTTMTSSKPDPRYPFLDKAFAIAMKCFLLEGALLMVAFGVVSIIAILVSSGNSINAAFRAIRPRNFVTFLPSFLGDQPNLFPTVIPRRYITRITTIGRVCIHIALHLCGLAVCLTLSVLITGVATTGYDFFKFIDNFFAIIMFGMIGFQITAMAVIVWLSNLIIIISMVSPLFTFRDSRRFRSSLVSP